MIAAAQVEKPKTSVQTTNLNDYDKRLARAPKVTYAKSRCMRRDPTIALAREVSIAPILSSQWGFQADDKYEDQREFIKWQMERIRRDFLRYSLLGQIDFGWKAYEKVFAVEDHPEHGTRIVLDKLKPLLNDITFAMYGRDTGNFLGLAQNDLHSSLDVVINASHSLFINFDDEGTTEYADPLMCAVEQPYDEWLETNAAANRYDTKVAGSHWLVYYPIGRSTYNGDEDVDNADIAKGVLSSLRSSGSVTVPVQVSSMMSDMNDQATGWKIELVDGAGKAADFVTRLKYLDSLKIRGMMVPERSIVEGTFGTKAEAESHFNAAMMIMQLRHEMLTDHLNQFLVNQLLETNYGMQDTVKLIAQPLVDEKVAMFQNLFTALTTNASTSLSVLDSINIEEVLDTLKIPHDEVDEDIAVMGDELILEEA